MVAEQEFFKGAIYLGAFAGMFTTSWRQLVIMAFVVGAAVTVGFVSNFGIIDAVSPMMTIPLLFLNFSALAGLGEMFAFPVRYAIRWFRSRSVQRQRAD